MWKERLEKLKDREEQAKKDFQVVVYGSYEIKNIGGLEQIVECLKKRGYSQTTLVKHMKFPNYQRKGATIRPLERSKIAIDLSDFNALIFFCDSDNQSVGREVSHVLGTSRNIEKSAFFEEKCNKHGAINSLFRDDFDMRRITTLDFENLEELCDLIDNSVYDRIRTILS